MDSEKSEIDWSGIKIGSLKRLNTRQYITQELEIALIGAILLPLGFHFFWPAYSFWTVMTLTAAGITGGILGGVLIRVVS